jgi:hypothetical protein
MHDPEKSDSGIVVTKPTNKAGRPVAEPVEPRPGTKGNADQQSTHRAQSRARVTQALSRVRQAARQRKKEKFTALLHHISVDTLRSYGAQRAPRVQQGVELRYGAAYAPARSQFAPVQDDFFGDNSKRRF